MTKYIDHSRRGEPKSEREKNGVCNTVRHYAPRILVRSPPRIIYVKVGELGQREAYTTHRKNSDDLEYILKERERSTTMNQKLRELTAERQRLSNRISEIDAEYNDERVRECRLEHPCECVKLNSDIKVFTMSDLTCQKRHALMYTGAVSEILSADELCRKCEGTGIPISGR